MLRPGRQVHPRCVGFRLARRGGHSMFEFQMSKMKSADIPVFKYFGIRAEAKLIVRCFAQSIVIEISTTLLQMILREAML